ncbi:MAG: SWF/SNF helicase family protein, partial [Thermoguttaceae bacterium]|nr:SWF/SNF helicase family protein [Thermoguttaceae bacterium]
SNEGKIIVFALHHKLLDPLTDGFKNSGKPKKPLLVRLDGKTPQKKRAEAVDAFQNGPARVFLGQMNTAGLGLTLTAARHSLFAELDYLPTSHLQAESRTRRIGSEGSYIQYNYLVMKDTLDEAVAQRLFARQKAINQVIDGRSEEDDAKMDDFNVLGGVLADDFGFSLV